MRTLNYAPEAWKYLNGFFCIYKPADAGFKQVVNSLCVNLCKDLNEMEKRPPKDYILLKGSVADGKPFSVEVSPNYADLELVSGSRYQPQDVRTSFIAALGKRCSGVSIVAVNRGCSLDQCTTLRNVLRTYEVNGKFGCTSSTFMADGIIKEKSTYSHIKQARLDTLLASIQSNHQSLAYDYSGVDIRSQKAYELASQGLVRPVEKSAPMIYGLKCTKFDLPEFTLEIQCVNETQIFLAELVHEIGLHMKSSAVCTQLRRTRYGCFTLDHALLRKHWTLEHILSNITLCKDILNKEALSPSSNFEAIKLSDLKEPVEAMQDRVREDAL